MVNLLPPCIPGGCWTTHLCYSLGHASLPAVAVSSFPSPELSGNCHRDLPVRVLVAPPPHWQERPQEEGNPMGRQGEASIHAVSLNCSISSLLLEQRSNKFSPQTSTLSRAIHSRGPRQHLTPSLCMFICSFSRKQTRYKQGIFLPSPSFLLETENKLSLWGQCFLFPKQRP